MAKIPGVYAVRFLSIIRKCFIDIKTYKCVRVETILFKNKFRFQYIVNFVDQKSLSTHSHDSTEDLETDDEDSYMSSNEDHPYLNIGSVSNFVWNCICYYFY